MESKINQLIDDLKETFDVLDFEIKDKKTELRDLKILRRSLKSKLFNVFKGCKK